MLQCHLTKVILLRPKHLAAQPSQIAKASGLETAAEKLSLEEKAASEAPLSKAQAKRLRKKLREGRTEV